jgi:hypothetical protein
VNTLTKIVTAGCAAVTLAGGIGAGIAAADTPTPSPSQTPSATASPSTGTKASKLPQTVRRHLFWVARTLHGEATLAGKQHRVVDFQRGTVERVSGTSIAVKSNDGFTATYTVDPATRVRKDNRLGTISDVAAQDRVRILATRTGSSVTAKVIRDHGTR